MDYDSEVHENPRLAMVKRVPRYNLSLFIFRRDLRLQDNTALIAALKNSREVVPCFIFDPRQCQNNQYKSEFSLQFLIESLRDLQKQLAKKSAKLFLFYGIAEKVVGRLIKDYKIDAVYVNRDYTPFSKARDLQIEKICQKSGVQFFSYDDALLLSPEETLKKDGQPYKVFTSFYKHVIKIKINKPQLNKFKNYYLGKKIISENRSLYEKIMPSQCSKNSIKGGRSECQKILHGLHKIVNYSKNRDFPYKDMTTHLSPYLKFTNCSVREIYFAILKKVQNPRELLRELYWRDFFTIIAFYYPHVFGKAFLPKFNNLVWSNDRKRFLAWCQGKTGFPIVDAAMRQLNATGCMHNRARLITASFLVKDLHISWLWGEKYFATKLLDYDPAVNNGNWQWVAGTGTDALPYFRIFNPWLQQKKYDPHCLYIKKWLPELAHLEPRIIHHWYNPIYHSLAKYPTPVIIHDEEVAKTKQIYRKV